MSPKFIKMMAFNAAESLAEEQRVSQELLIESEKRYQNQVRLLEQGKEEAEQSLSEVRAQLNRERAQWQEDLSAAQRQAKVREVCSIVFKNLNGCVLYELYGLCSIEQQDDYDELGRMWKEIVMSIFEITIPVFALSDRRTVRNVEKASLQAKSRT
jgi:hypothetical protein